MPKLTKIQLAKLAKVKAESADKLALREALVAKLLPFANTAQNLLNSKIKHFGYKICSTGEGYYAILDGNDYTVAILADNNADLAKLLRRELDAKSLVQLKQLAKKPIVPEMLTSANIDAQQAFLANMSEKEANIAEAKAKIAKKKAELDLLEAELEKLMEAI